MHSIQSFNLHPDKPENNTSHISKVQERFGLGLENQRIGVGSGEVCVGNALRNLAPTVAGSGSSNSEMSVNFHGGDNTKVERELPRDHTRRGEIEGGLPPDHMFIQGETSSVGSSMSERRNLAKGKEDVINEDEYQTPENVRRLREIWEQGTKQSCLRWRSKGGLGPLHY